MAPDIFLGFDEKTGMSDVPILIDALEELVEGFFQEIINYLRGIKSSVATYFSRSRNYPIGSIISGG